jgi:hypothetical protein
VTQGGADQGIDDEGVRDREAPRDRCDIAAGTNGKVRSEHAGARDEDGLRHDAHALVLDDAAEIRMANPFAARPTDFRVEAGERTWYANCAWDAFGIGAAMHVDSRFETHCPDCDELIEINVRDGQPDDRSPVFHVLVPAARWWSDIGFT